MAETKIDVISLVNNKRRHFTQAERCYLACCSMWQK